MVTTKFCFNFRTSLFGLRFFVTITLVRWLPTVKIFFYHVHFVAKMNADRIKEDMGSQEEHIFSFLFFFNSHKFSDTTRVMITTWVFLSKLHSSLTIITQRQSAAPKEKPHTWNKNWWDIYKLLSWIQWEHMPAWETHLR